MAGSWCTVHQPSVLAWWWCLHRAWRFASQVCGSRACCSGLRGEVVRDAVVDLAAGRGLAAAGERARDVAGHHCPGQVRAGSVGGGADGADLAGGRVREHPAPGGVLGELTGDLRGDRTVRPEVRGRVVQPEQGGGRDGHLQRDPLPVPGRQRAAVGRGLAVQDRGEHVGERVRAALVHRPGVPVRRGVAGQGVDRGERRGGLGGGQVRDQPGHRVGRQVQHEDAGRRSTTRRRSATAGSAAIRVARTCRVS